MPATSDRLTRAALLAALGWCVVFAVPHVFWALGGRAGLGDQAAAADAALATPWFAAYNAATAVLCVVGAVLAVAELSGRTRLLARRRARRLLLALAVLLGVRAAIGIAGVAVDVVRGTLESPPVLVAVEGWFLLGAAVALALGRAARPGVDTGPRG